MRTGTLIDLTVRGGDGAAIDWPTISARLAAAFPEAIVLDGAAGRRGLSLALPPREDAEAEDETPPGMDCLLYLLTSRLGGTTVGALVQSAAKGMHHARNCLREAGMDVRPAPPGCGQTEAALWVAYHNRQLSLVFAASPWATPQGMCGAWVRALSRIATATGRVSFHCGGQTKAVLIPLSLILPQDEGGGE